MRIVHSRSDLYTWNSLHNVLGRYNGFRFANIGLSVYRVRRVTRRKAKG